MKGPLAKGPLTKGPTRMGQSQGTPCPLDLYKYIINPINENPIIPFTFTLNTIVVAFSQSLPHWIFNVFPLARRAS